MIANTSFGVASVQVSRLPIGVCQIEGTYLGAAAAYLQVHDSCITPAAGAVPIYQLPINPNAQFCETLQVSQLQVQEGLFVAVSSTDGTFTASASTMDITVWTDKQVVTTNAVGDKTTALSNKQIWSEATGAAGSKRLLQLIVKEFLGQTAYVYISPRDDFGACPPPILLPANGTIKILFGQGGIIPFLQDVDGTQRHGCSITISNQANATIGVAPTVNLLAGTILAITN